MSGLRRRDFVTLLGGAAVAWPLAARAQQAAMPVMGYLNAASPESISPRMAAFREGLAQTGYLEGQNVAIEYRAEGHYGRLPEMAAELVRRQVAVIVAIPIPAALAAKAATATIPIVFGVGTDPVKLGLVTNLARPDGNATGVSFFIAELGAKQLGLLRELVPAASRIGLLVNPNNLNAEGVAKDVTAAASTIGVKIDIIQASDSREIEAAFATLVRNRVAPTRSSSTGGSNLLPWPRATRSPPSIFGVSSPRRAAS
jgi:putative ABC transport system substrate-binding protein